MKQSSQKWAIEYWCDELAAQNIEYASYWNDQETEREKPWWILDGNFQKLEDYLESSGLKADLAYTLQKLATPLRGVGIDLAAGILWAARPLVEAGEIETLYCLEYSRHRLLDIGCKVLENDGLDPDQIVLAFGSFYDIHLPDNQLDFIFLCQAFHHADDPDALLSEMRRVLKPNGIVIIIGEHMIRPLTYAAYALRAGKSGISQKILRTKNDRPSSRRLTFKPAGKDLIPTDPTLGDHFYTSSEYKSMFKRHGFTAERIHRSRSTFQSFILR